jgi:hypothetical protein
VLLESVAQRTLASLPQRAGSSHGLWFPSAHQGSEVYLPRGFQASLSSALRVWLPSRRLTPSEPVSTLFRADSAPGISPFGAFPLARCPRRFRSRRTHMPFLRPIPPSPKQQPVSVGRGSWALALARVPCAWHVFSTPARRILPWAFSLPGPSRSSLERVSARSPLPRFAGPPRGTVQSCATEYQSAPAWPHPFSIASHRIRTRQPS